jgi:hypothetical protein
MNGIVQVTHDVRIRFDGCYTIERRAVVGAGGPRKTKAENVGAIRWDAVGFYGDLMSAAKALLGRHFVLLDDGPAERELRGLIEAICRAGERVEAALAATKADSAAEPA